MILSWRSLMKILTISFLILTLGACSSVGTIQGAAEPYSIEVNGQADGLIAANLRFIAIDAQVEFTLRFRKNETILWEKTFERGSGRRAYQIVFSDDDNFVDIVETTWEVARSSLRWLPGDPQPQP
jgi:hypothetical protein